MTTDVRTALYDVITRFSRGVDRKDADLVRSCYHPDAYDDHGVFKGGPDEFAAWLQEVTAPVEFMQHSVSNFHLLDVAENVATSETYWHLRILGTDGQLAQAFGRYLDRFEQRDGRWLIAHRICTMEFSTPNSGYDPADFERGTHDRSDPSYRLSDVGSMS